MSLECHESPVRADGACRGFSLVELCVVMAIIVIMATMSIPIMQSTLAFYDLQAAVAGVSGSIQSTRYQAISSGYPYKISFSKADRNYTVWSCSNGYDPANPNACGFTQVPGATPIGSSSSVKLGSDTTIEFFPNGRVTLLSGNNPITLSRAVGSKTNTKSITVSTYGSVKVQ